MLQVLRDSEPSPLRESGVGVTRKQVDVVEWAAAVIVGCLIGAAAIVVGALLWARFA